MKTVKERDDLDLLELSHQLHARSIRSMNKAQHDAYVEARTEVERRIKSYKDELDKLKALLGNCSIGFSQASFDCGKKINIHLKGNYLQRQDILKDLKRNAMPQQ